VKIDLKGYAERHPELAARVDLGGAKKAGLPPQAEEGRYGVQGGALPIESKPAGLTGWIVRAMPCPAYTGRGKTRQPDPTKPPVLKLVGYYTTGSNPNWSRKKEYEAWKDHVRERTLSVPRATAACPVRLDVWCYFGSGVHADPENVRKGIVDALFPDGDKWVYGYHHSPLYSDAPHVLIHMSGGER